MILIKTERLLIRHVKESDAEFILDLLNSPSWLKYIGDKGIIDLDSALGYIKSMKQSYIDNGFGLYVMDLISTRNPIGICGFVQREFLENPDLGFAILPKYERQGYTLEASQSVLTYGKTNLQLDSIIAITTKNNSKAIKLLHKLGMRYNRTIFCDEPKNKFMLFDFN